jgi:hypothetical protein
MIRKHRYAPIRIGYAWGITLFVSGATFPADAAFRAHVRTEREASEVLAELTTAAGGITRLDATRLSLAIPAAATATFPAGTVVLDVVRTDLDPDQHLGFEITIPVDQAVTR